jgi:Hydrazine synthase alpha subunit middle domain
LAADVLQAVSASSQNANLQAKATPPEILFVAAPVVGSGTLLRRFPDGSSLLRLNTANRSSKPLNLTPDFFAVADPEVSFDASHVLFAGQKRAAGKWQIWEMTADGSSPRQITQCLSDCLGAAYLPDDEIVYTATDGRASRLAVCKLDGSQAHDITFAPGDFQVESVLRDGRILASANSPLTATGAKSRILYTLRPDGTGLDPLRSHNLFTAIEHEGTELDDGSIVFVNSNTRGEAGGALSEIQHGRIDESRLAATGIFSSPRQLTPDELIVSRLSPNSVTASSTPRFDLYAFRLESHTFGKLIHADAHKSSLQPVAIAPHPAPKKFWSLVNSSAGSGYFICLDSRMTADRRMGKFSVPITRVHVVGLDPKTKAESSLGDAPVESDGSFYIAVPANQPVRFELLDGKGHLVHAQRGWIWSRPGEEHGCAGCHEDRALAPENRWPLTLKRFDTPTLMGVKGHAAKP